LQRSSSIAKKVTLGRRLCWMCWCFGCVDESPQVSIARNSTGEELHRLVNEEGDSLAFQWQLVRPVLNSLYTRSYKYNKFHFVTICHNMSHYILLILIFTLMNLIYSQMFLKIGYTLHFRPVFWGNMMSFTMGFRGSRNANRQALASSSVSTLRDIDEKHQALFWNTFWSFWSSGLWNGLPYWIHI